MPQACVRGLPFSIGKGSMAALKGAASEQRGSKGEHEGATREQERACRDMLTLVPSLGGAQQVGA